MSYSRDQEKDYDQEAAKTDLPEHKDKPGLYLPNGEVNWDFPCFNGIANGPCGSAFREAFTCVKNSSAEPRGVDCFEQLKVVQECFNKYPKLYEDSRDITKDENKKVET